MPDLRELRAFVAVAEQLSFTRAAARLHLAQQTVSRTISDLERELGVALLERTSREVTLTAAGRALLEPSREVLRSAEAAFELARAVGTGRLGAIRVGVSPAVGPQDRAAVVAALREGSERSVSLRELRPSDISASLHDREIDLVIASSSGTVAPGLESAPLRSTQMQAVVVSDHPLAGAGTAGLADFNGHRLLVASRAGTPYTDRLLERFEAAGSTVTPVEAHVTGGAQLLTELAGADMLAAMPSGTALPPSLTALDVPGFTMPLVVVWRAGRPPEGLTQLRARLARVED